MPAKPTVKKIKTAVATFSIALGIGFVMQYGDAMAARWGDDVPVGGPMSQPENDINLAVLTPVTASVVGTQSMSIPAVVKSSVRVASTIVPLEIETPSFTALTQSVADVAPPVTETPLVTLAAVDVQDIEAEEQIADAPVCTQTLDTTPAGFAMVTLSYAAPCDANSTVTVLHEDMMFEVVTDANGTFELDVPALSQEALYGVASANEESVFSITAVPEIAAYDRVVLQWQGNSGVQLHALEFGATYGDAGHVWSAAAGDRVNAASGSSGFLTHLGHGSAVEGFFADVYTFPTGLSAMDGKIALSVEVEVTDMNCGRTVKAQTMQVNPSDRPTTQRLVMTMPGCDAIGEFLVLNNMYEDLTLASK